MTTAARRRLEGEREALLTRLHTLPNVMRGSLYARGRKGGRASCACAQGGPKHPTRQLTVTLLGATRSRYVRLEEVAPVRALLATYGELWALVNALTAVNLALLHRTPPSGRTPPRRPPPMSQGLLPYPVEVVAQADTVTGRTGLPRILETRRALGLDQAIAAHVHVRGRQSGYPETAKVEALVLLLAAGGDCLDDLRVLQADAGRARLLDRTLPSADTLRHFLYACHDDALSAQAQAQRPPDRVAYIPAETAALQGLAHVNTALVHRVAAEGRNPTATLDHDATIQESHTREALGHPPGGRGYQPAAISWGEQDLVVADEVPGTGTSRPAWRASPSSSGASRIAPPP